MLLQLTALYVITVGLSACYVSERKRSPTLRAQFVTLCEDIELQHRHAVPEGIPDS